MFARHTPRVFKIFRNKYRILALLIFLGTIFLTVLIYILTGVQQCYVPVTGVENKQCTEIVDELVQASTPPTGISSEYIPVHQHNIALNLTSLHFDSRNDWKGKFENYMFHNATMARDVIKNYYPHLLKLYDSYPDDIQRADVSRVAILHHYGGIYGDLDAFPAYHSQKLTQYKLNDLKSAYFPVGNGNVVVNHFFITNKNNPFLGYLLNSYEKLNRHWKWMPLPYLRVFLTTGPCAVQIALRDWQKMWEEQGVTPAPSIKTMTRSACLAKHETGRQWLSIDGKFFNWVGDNTTLFINYLISIVVGVIILIAIIIAIIKFKRSNNEFIKKIRERLSLRNAFISLKYSKLF
eukprot:jgi/Orpsp1_1/1188856/evm.model.d7180000067735.1